jgi:diguanylate cyclase (GGDEF)-like protein
MDNYQEQFRQELAYQETKSNKYTLKGFTWFILAVGLIWLLTIIGIFEIDKKLISIAFLVNIVLFIFATWIGRKENLSEPWIKYVFLSLICIGSAVIAAFLSYHAVLAFVIPLLIAIQYRRKSMIWFAYVVNLVTMLVSSFISFYYGICDLNILFESQHVRKWYIDRIASGIWNPVYNDNPIFIILVFEVFPRCIIFLVFSVIIQYAVINSNEDARRISQLTYLKETDMGTRAFNKNKYKEMVSEYYPKVKQIAVLFWDLNHLKNINDQYGHSVGDKAIQGLAAALLVHADNHCRVFRIGGDEFLMIVDDPEPNESEMLIQSVKERLKIENENTAAQNRNDMVQISSAVGCALGNGKNIIEIVKTADRNMYVDKKRTGGI